MVVVGRPSVAESSAFADDALAALHAAVPAATFLSALRRGNVRGALDLGLARACCPAASRSTTPVVPCGRRGRPHPSQPGSMLAASSRAAADREIGCLVLLGADPLTDFPDRDLARRGLEGVGTVVAVDAFSRRRRSRPTSCSRPPPSARRPARRRTSRVGSARSARRSRVAGPRTADWMIAVELAERLGPDLGFGSSTSVGRDPRGVAPSRRHHASALAGEHDGVVAGPARRRSAVGHRRAAVERLRLPAGRRPRALRRRRVHRPVTVAGRLAARRRLHVNPWDADRLGEPRARRSR